MISIDNELSHPVHWRGSQWAVTAFGIECLSNFYEIEKERLWDSEEVHGWEQHMSEKNWVNMPDFRQALCLAREIFSQFKPKRLCHA